MKVLGYEIVDQQLNAVIDVVNGTCFTQKDLEDAMRDNNVERPPMLAFNEDLVYNRAASIIMRNLSLTNAIKVVSLDDNTWANITPVTYVLNEDAPQFMTLNDYQDFTEFTDISPLSLDYYLLKLNEEAGEAAGKLGKLMRGDYENEPKEHFRTLLALELGDVLWYLARTAKILSLTLEDVAQMNIEKLADRQARGVIKGSGDNR